MLTHISMLEVLIAEGGYPFVYMVGLYTLYIGMDSSPVLSMVFFSREYQTKLNVPLAVLGVLWYWFYYF